MIPAAPLPAGAVVPETFIVVIRDRANGKLTLSETDAGESLKDAAGYLTLGMAPRGFDPVAVISTKAGDVTARVLHQVACICEAEERELDERLIPVFAAHDVPLPVTAASEPYQDENDEHRIGAWDVLGGRAA